MSKFALGSAILISLGAVANILLAKKLKDYDWLFREKHKLNENLRYLRDYKWDDLNFNEVTVWKPKYRDLLRKSRCVK